MIREQFLGLCKRKFILGKISAVLSGIRNTMNEQIMKQIRMKNLLVFHLLDQGVNLLALGGSSK